MCYLPDLAIPGTSGVRTSDLGGLGNPNPTKAFETGRDLIQKLPSIATYGIGERVLAEAERQKAIEAANKNLVQSAPPKPGEFVLNELNRTGVDKLKNPVVSAFLPQITKG